MSEKSRLLATIISSSAYLTCSMKGSLLIVLAHQKRRGGESRDNGPLTKTTRGAGFSWNHPSWYLPWFYLSLIWTFLFLPSWLAKDRSDQRVYTRITLRTDAGQPPPPCPSSYIEKTRPTSPRSVCSILPYLSVCIIDHRAGGERLCESSQCKTTGGAARSLGQTIQNVTNFHTRRNRQKIWRTYLNATLAN